MNRTILNFWIDVVSFVNILIITITGFILKYGFSRGRQGAEIGEVIAFGKTFLGITRRQWGEIHFIFAQIVCLLIIVHIYLHWDWIKNVAMKYYLKSSVEEEPCEVMSPQDLDDDIVDGEVIENEIIEE